MIISIQIPNAISQNTSVEDDDLTNKGHDIFNAGDYNGALAYADKALAIDPNNTYSLILKGDALFNLGDHKGAIEQYDKALAIDPSNEMALTSKQLAQLDLSGPVNDTGP
jgi:tetratricopeptide (TPR) repeat protein